MNELILIVDDEEGILTTMSQVLGDEGFRTLTTTSGAEALDLYREHHPDVVFLDIWLPDKDGLEVLQAILEMDPQALVVMMSGHGTSSTAVKSIKMGAQDYLEKPLSYDQTVAAVHDSLKARGKRASAGDSGVLEASKHQPVGKLEPPVGARPAGDNRPAAAHDQISQRDLRARAALGRSHRDGDPATAPRYRDPLSHPTRGQRDSGPYQRRGGDRLRHVHHPPG